MTPQRKQLALGRAAAGRKSMGGSTSIHGNSTMGGSKDFSLFYLFIYFFFFSIKLENDAFVLPRESKSKDEEKIKKTLLNIF